MKVCASHATCADARILANRGLSTACTLIIVILLIQLVACKRGSAGQGQGGREPGAQVIFDVELTGVPPGPNADAYQGTYAEVTIDGKLIYSVPPYGESGSVFLSKGDYRIRVAAEGFEAVEKEVSIQDSPTPQFLHFTLRWKK